MRWRIRLLISTRKQGGGQGHRVRTGLSLVFGAVMTLAFSSTAAAQAILPDIAYAEGGNELIWANSDALVDLRAARETGARTQTLAGGDWFFAPPKEERLGDGDASCVRAPLRPRPTHFGGREEAGPLAQAIADSEAIVVGHVEEAVHGIWAGQPGTMLVVAIERVIAWRAQSNAPARVAVFYPTPVISLGGVAVCPTGEAWPDAPGVHARTLLLAQGPDLGTFRDIVDLPAGQSGVVYGDDQLSMPAVLESDQSMPATQTMDRMIRRVAKLERERKQ